MPGIFSKPGWLLVFLAAAFVIPYLIFDERLGAAVSKALDRRPKDAAPSSEQARLQTNADPSAQSTTALFAPPSADQTPLCDMTTAMRLDVTPQWVTATWPSVTTVVGDTSHAGMRVPLVTGVMADDLVGTLTYYFDDQQRVQRLTFAGITGDSRRLVALITSQYGLKPQPTLDAGLYQTKWNGKPISTLHIRRAPVVSAAAAHGKFDVELELKRADALAGTAAVPRLLGW